MRRRVVSEARTSASGASAPGGHALGGADLGADLGDQGGDGGGLRVRGDHQDVAGVEEDGRVAVGQGGGAGQGGGEAVGGALDVEQAGGSGGGLGAGDASRQHVQARVARLCAKMIPMIGRTLGHYRIESKIGQGGMGVVYKAQDTHLDRPVAVKVLPPEATANPERIRRFVQEAKAASALNHPNIITIYDIDQADGVYFMAMEFVAGRNLGERIGRKALRAEEAVRYAVQIAAALERAHAAGIVHRDLKPGNVMVTEDGLVKVLDFGLALLTRLAEASDAEATLTQAARTEDGVILGTVAYMSPEQAEGKKLDARSDIFSFGSVLYEMVSGRRAFAGESMASTWSAILTKQPQPVREIVAEVPRDVERVIGLCLEKDAARRLQHMGDAKILLERVAPEAEAAPVTAKSRRPAAALAAAALVVSSAAGWWWMRRSPTPAAPPPVLTRLTSDSGLSTDPSLSRDGKLLAFASDRSGDGHLDIWVKQVAGGQPIRLTNAPVDDHQPAFSPDGSQIVYRSERTDGAGLYVVPALGGEPRLLAPHGRNPRFSPDGKSIAYWTGEPHTLGKIHLVSATGGAPRELAPPLAGYPIWSPDGKRLLFLRSDQFQAGFEWWIASVGSGEAIRTDVLATLARQGLPVSILSFPGDWLDSRVFFSQRSGDARGVWQVEMGRDGRVGRPANPVTFGATQDAAPSLGASGRLVYASLVENVDVWSMALDAAGDKPPGEPQRLTQDAASDSRPSISLDGRLAVFLSNRAGPQNAWLKDLLTGREAPLTVDPSNKGNTLIAANGTHVAYSAEGSTYLMALRPGGQHGLPEPGTPEKVCEKCGSLSDLSPDGRKLLYYNPAMLFDISSRAKKTVLFGPGVVLDPRFSPDQRWVAFHRLDGAPRRQILVAPLEPTPPEQWIAITEGDAMDRYPTWSADGNLLYWVSERDGFRCLAARRLHPATKKPVGAMFYVQHLHSARRSMMYLPSVAAARPSVARDKILFTLTERTGNIWMTEVRQPGGQ